MRGWRATDAGLTYVVVFSLVVGSGLPAFWMLLLASGKVVELKQGRKDIWFHIGAEVLTGALLVSAAIGVLVDHGAAWSELLSGLAFGMLVYTLIQSPGYYVDRGDRAMLTMFGGIWLLTLPAVALRFLY